ncbi:ABC transporter substrate-binding protein [Actinomadura sp. ATCC 31491]|uniref:ABC transporter substrate-binding protein n=1 Tax=Actinomadura luzonensis TaxID=2805427 RepID=A0ABT0FTZ6_9ACTN|nr:ABC transporter substrate-binding protein [Actinomadura luzonensis]MCK2215817.1 ABC transporter substrate-binding protein [Actinomadura luzonensis]
MRRVLPALLPVLLLLLVAGCRPGSGGAVLTGECAGQDGTGVSPGTIKVGGIYPLSGPASAYAAVAQGASAYFAHVNQHGGVDGRRIDFVVRDDAYEPARAVEQARRLVLDDRVFALFQTLGTPSTAAVREFAHRWRVPQVFVASGATQWGADAARRPWTIGFQPSYLAEARVYARYLAEELPHARVAVLYQNDDFGHDLLGGFREAVAGTSVRIVAERSYEVTDPGVQGQLANLAASGADVLLDVSTPKFAAQALAADAAMTGWNPLHILNGVAASPAVLKPVGYDKVQGVVTAGFTKDPAAPEWADDPAVHAYLTALERYAPDADPGSQQVVFGWTAAEAFVKTLRRMRCPSREALRAAAHSLREVQLGLLLPGITVSTGPGDAFPIEAEQLSRFEGDRWVPFGRVIDTRAPAR